METTKNADDQDDCKHTYCWQPVASRRDVDVTDLPFPILDFFELLPRYGRISIAAGTVPAALNSLAVSMKT